MLTQEAFVLIAVEVFQNKKMKKTKAVSVLLCFTGVAGIKTEEYECWRNAKQTCIYYR